MKINQQNHSGMFRYLTQVKAVAFASISATSYYQSLGSTSSKIASGNYSQQRNHTLKYRRTRNQSGRTAATCS